MSSFINDDHGVILQYSSMPDKHAHTGDCTTKIDTLIRNIARVISVKDEQLVRETALMVVEFYMPSNYSQEQLLEMLYLYLADGQEMRSIVHEFRAKISDLVGTL